MKGHCQKKAVSFPKKTRFCSNPNESKRRRINSTKWWLNLKLFSATKIGMQTKVCSNQPKNTETPVYRCSRPWWRVTQLSACIDLLVHRSQKENTNPSKDIFLLCFRIWNYLGTSILCKQLTNRFTEVSIHSLVAFTRNQIIRWTALVHGLHFKVLRLMKR